MSIQGQEEGEFYRMSPYEFDKAAVQQEGYLRPAAEFLLTDYDTWVSNPFWDGKQRMDFSEGSEGWDEEAPSEALQALADRAREEAYEITVCIRCDNVMRRDHIDDDVCPNCT